jgi:hypothetical protein
MDLHYTIPHHWQWYCILTGLSFLTTLWMLYYQKSFFTRDGVTRVFTIRDLEFPSSGNDLADILNGIYKLPQSGNIISALRKNLFVDFLFMPATYISLFILCMAVSHKMNSQFGRMGFQIFAWLQFLAWLLDIFENVYLLRKTKPNVEAPSKSSFLVYSFAVHIKWAIALVGGICSMMVLLYFWIEGKFDKGNLHYLLIIIAEIVGFVLLNNWMKSGVKKAVSL